MTTMSEGILDSVVQEILNNHEYLTPQNVADLRNALPRERTADSDVGDAFDMRALIERQTRMYEKAVIALGTSNNTLDFQRLQQMGTKLMKSYDEYADKMRVGERHRHMENAVVETLEALSDPSIKAEFMAKLAEFLGQKG